MSGAADTGSSGLTAGSYAAVSGKRNVFETLHQFASELGNGNPVDRYIADIQMALDHVVDARAGVGARMNALDAQHEINADLKLVLESHRSEEQDLNFTEAITRFELQQVSLQAAQQAYVQVQRLSLFDYL
jgi:flagellar hook-associated protein 3 FlgL